MPAFTGFSKQLVNERSAEFFVPKGKTISKKLPVFYNPIMSLNRDISVLMLRIFRPKYVCDLMAGTGVRSIRFCKESPRCDITSNDSSQTACSLMKENMVHNKVEFKIENKDANLLLAESTGFDYIDIDPFGTPVQFLDSSIKRISRKGILAVTATDTSSLCGTLPKACLRKYWSIPSHSSTMHEIGLRILIRRIQLIGAQYDKSLTPVFSY